MRNTLETRLGIFFAMAMLAAVIIIQIIGGFDFFKGGYVLKARFNTIQELKRGDVVKMAGIQIGRVEKMEFNEDKVTVFMKINDKKAAVKTDSKAIIKFQGFMGQNYVSIGFGSATAPKADTGTELTTLEQPDLSTLASKLEEVLTDVGKMTSSFGGDSFGKLLAPFTDFLSENKGNLSDTISNIHTISSEIATGKGTVGKLINEKTLYESALASMTNLNDTATDIKAAVNQAKTVMTGITNGEGTIGKLVKDQTLYNETTAAITNAKEILEKVNRGQGTAGKIVNDETLYKNARMTLQKLDKATEGLEDQGPLSVIGIMAGKLF